VGLNSPPTCQLRQGGTNDAVNQQLKELKMKRIKIDDNNYIKVLPDGDFELHCYARGPTGANVYYFKNNSGGLLEWTQRRSYSGMGKIYNLKLDEQKK
jgi:hypothetical protein